MKRSRIEAFNSLRAVACLFVIGYHMHLTDIGHLFVTVFFMLSGFLSVYNHIDSYDTEHITLKGCVGYARERILKLYPLYFLTLLVPLAGQVYGALNGMVTVGEVVLKAVSCALLVQSWLPMKEVYFGLNGPGWYLSSLVFAYFMFPYVLRGIKKLRSRGAAVGVCVALCAAELLVRAAGNGIYAALGLVDSARATDFQLWLEYVFPVIRLADFAMGACVAYIFLNRTPTKLSKPAWTAAELALIIVAFWLQVAYSDFSLPLDNSTVIFLPICALLIYAFAVNEGYVSKLLTNKPIKLLSDISTEIYLSQSAVLFVCTPIITSLPLTFKVQQAVYIICIPAVTLAVSLVGRRINRAFARRRKARAAA